MSRVLFAALGALIPAILLAGCAAYPSAPGVTVQAGARVQVGSEIRGPRPGEQGFCP